ncbi:MAG: pseudouridine synthase [Dehalococcoidia bacterium]|jgi:23S rRNA pseudouridine2605 synthase|nr:pseudouridine synthase [Dehalococcoidia bacterium]
MKSIPLVRVLTDAGYGSRREASKLIDAGMVEVNGRIASSFTEKVNPETDSVVVVGKKVASVAARRVYIVMNKPAGYLSTTDDDRGRATVLDLLPEDLRCEGLHPAGRLDEDSTGLLILTNDGQFTYELTHPRYEHDKEYYVATTGRLTEADMRELEKGVEVEEQMTWPARITLLEGQSPYSYSIIIHEGRKRQVRQMFAAVGQQVALLKRVRIGDLLLGNLPEGGARELTAAELRALMRKRPTRTASAATRGESRKRAALPAKPAGAKRPFTGPQLMRRASPGEGSGAAPERMEREGPRAAPRRAASARPSPLSDRRAAGPAVERPYRRPATARPSASFDRGAAGPAVERPYRRPAAARPSASFDRRPAGPAVERPYRRPAAARPSPSFDRRAAGPAAERPYRRPAAARPAPSFDRRAAGPAVERPYRRPAAARPAPSFDRRAAGPAVERPYRRPASARPSPSFDRGAAGPATERPYRRPTAARTAPSFDRRTSGPAAERPYGRTTGQTSGRPYVRRTDGPAGERTERRTGERVRAPGDVSSPRRRPAREGDARPPGTSPSAGRRRPSAPR